MNDDRASEALRPDIIQRRADPSPMMVEDDGREDASPQEALTPPTWIRRRTRANQPQCEPEVSENIWAPVDAEVAFNPDAETLEIWEGLGAERASFPLTPELDRLNAFARETSCGRRLFGYLRHRLFEYQHRYLISMGGKGAKVLFDAVVARTVGFGKYVEQITYDQFINGLRDEEGNFIELDGGCPVFAGVGVNRKTFMRWRRALIETELVEALDYTTRRGSFVAYMPERLFVELAWAEHIRQIENEEERNRADTLSSMVMWDVRKRWGPDQKPVVARQLKYNLASFISFGSVSATLETQRAQELELVQEQEHGDDTP